MENLSPEIVAALNKASKELPKGYAIVEETQLKTIVEERSTMLKGILSIGPLFSGLNPTGEMDIMSLVAALQPLLQDKEKLAVELAPLSAIIAKYSKKQG